MKERMKKERKKKMFIYNIPVQIKGEDNIVFKKEITIAAENKRIATGIAGKVAKGKFLKIFPTHRIEEIIIDVKNITVRASLEKKQKERKPRARSLFRSKSIKETCILEGKEIVKDLGDTRIVHKIVEYGEYCFYLLEKEIAKVIQYDNEERVIIEGYEDSSLAYLKVLTFNSEGEKVFIRWEKEINSDKLSSYIEFFYNSSYSNWIPKNEFYKTKKIAQKYLKERR